MKVQKKHIKIIVFILLIISVITIILQPKVRQNITPENIKRFINTYKSASVFIFLAMYSIRPIFLILPLSPFAIAAGSVFGIIPGAIYIMIGNFTSATIAFFIARYLAKDMIEHFVKGKVKSLNESVESNGFKIILMMRLAMIFHYDILSYACGISKMKYKDFILGTLIGVIPEMIAYSYVGYNLTKPFDEKTIFAIFIVLIIVIMPIIIKHRQKMVSKGKQE